MGKLQLQPRHAYFQKYGNSICLFVHNPNTNKTVHKSIKALCGYVIKTDCCFWDKDKHCFKEYSDKKGKCRIETAHTDNSRLTSLQATINGILESTPCYTPNDLYNAYNVSLGIVCKTPTSKQTLLEYAVYYRDLWKSGNVRNYEVKSTNYQLYDKFISKLKGTKYGVVMPWAKQMKKFADMPIADIDNDTYKSFCKLVASYCTKEHKDNKTDIAYKDTVKIFRAVVYHYQEENGNDDFRFTYIAFGKKAPKPQSKNVHQTLTDEQLKQLWEFDVTRIMPKIAKETKQLYLDTCFLMYKELSRPYDIISMRIEDIKTEKDGTMLWKYCAKKKQNQKTDDPNENYNEVPIHKDCIQIIQKYKGKRKKGYLLPFKQNQKEKTNNRDTDVSHIREKIRTFMLEIDKYYNWNIENLSMYNLRHTVITNVMRDKLLDIETTAIVAKTSPRMIRKTYANKNEISKHANISLI